MPRALAREREKVGWVRDVTQHSHVIGRSCTCCSPPQFQYNNFLESINNDFVFLYWTRDAIKKLVEIEKFFYFGITKLFLGSLSFPAPERATGEEPSVALDIPTMQRRDSFISSLRATKMNVLMQGKTLGRAGARNRTLLRCTCQIRS